MICKSEWVDQAYWAAGIRRAVERIEECLEVLAHSPPMTPVEMNRHFVRCSEEMARAEARRGNFHQEHLRF